MYTYTSGELLQPEEKAYPPTPPLLPFFRARVSAKNVALIFATPTALFPSAFIAFQNKGRRQAHP